MSVAARDDAVAVADVEVAVPADLAAFSRGGAMTFNWASVCGVAGAITGGFCVAGEVGGFFGAGSGAAFGTAASATGAGALAGAATGAGGGAEYGKLNGVLFAGTLWAGDFLLFVDDNFLELGAAIFANVFVDRHLDRSFS